jgi:hypothetical protein
MATFVRAGTRIELTATTVTLPLATGMLTAEAVMTAAPGATPVTGTLAVVAPVVKVTVAGTVATPVALEDRFTVRPPACAGPLRTRVRFCVAVPLIVMAAGLNAMVYPTRTLVEAFARPEPAADTVTVPALTPVTLVEMLGVVCPVLKKRLD